MSRSMKSISYGSTPKSREDQRANHHVIRAITREVLNQIDLDNVENVDLVIPKLGRQTYDLVDFKSRMSFHPLGSSFWKWISPEAAAEELTKGWRK